MNEFPLNHVRMWPFQTGIPCHFIIRRRRSLRVTLSPPPISFCWSQPREVLYKHGKTMLVIRPASIRLYTVFLWPTAHFPIPILFYFDANRGLPWLCPGSFSSVRLMLSICDNKFAPIPSRENMHLSFWVLISLFSLSLAVLDSRLRFFLRFRILRFLRLYFLEIVVAWLLCQARAFCWRSPSVLDSLCVCPRFHTDLMFYWTAAYLNGIKR